MLALSAVLMVLGGLSIDLWRVLAERRLLAATADAAAVAAVSAIDLSLYRDPAAVPTAVDEPVRLDPVLAEQRALESIRRSGVRLSADPRIDFEDGDTRIVVQVENRIEFGLLRLLAGDFEGGFTVIAGAEATATEFD
jgi:hypothetical protein